VDAEIYGGVSRAGDSKGLNEMEHLFGPLLATIIFAVIGFFSLPSLWPNTGTKITKARDIVTVKSGRPFFWVMTCVTIVAVIALALLLTRGRITVREAQILSFLLSVSIATFLCFRTAVTLSFDLMSRSYTVRYRSLEALWRWPHTHSFDEVAGVCVLRLVQLNDESSVQSFVPVLRMVDGSYEAIEGGHFFEDDALETLNSVCRATGLPRHCRSG
jgi:hypothetical protein